LARRVVVSVDKWISFSLTEEAAVLVKHLRKVGQRPLARV
jgi:hypothetical protein